jgi:hypothetical protein
MSELAEREGFAAALILKAAGISLDKFSWLDGKSKVENGSRFGSRYERLLALEHPGHEDAHWLGNQEHQR